MKNFVRNTIKMDLQNVAIEARGSKSTYGWEELKDDDQNELKNRINRTAREVRISCRIYFDIANNQMLLDLPASNEDDGTLAFLSWDFAGMDLRKLMENFNFCLNSYYSNNWYFDQLRDSNLIHLFLQDMSEILRDEFWRICSSDTSRSFFLIAFLSIKLSIFPHFHVIISFQPLSQCFFLSVQSSPHCHSSVDHLMDMWYEI
jgi:hypothetical protein